MTTIVAQLSLIGGAGAIVLQALGTSDILGAPRTLALAVPRQGVRSATPCDAPGADRWIVGARDRALAHDDLVRYAVESHGEPTSCEGAVTSHFDGVAFGQLTLRFETGVTVEIETMPPETSIVSLRAPHGFENEAQVLATLRTYIAARGLSVDWGAPVRRSEGGESVEVFWDTDPGLNASVTVTRSMGRLTAVRVSMAL